MNYRATIKYLESLQSTKIKLGLERVNSACEALGHPERKFPSVIVAGTNGKGSTCAFLESLFRRHGLKVGLYISPHLTDVRERIQINREIIGEEEFGRVVEQVRCHCERPSGAKQSPVSNYVREIASPPLADRNDMQLTYFEFLAIMAFLYFAEQSVDMAVLEVGLGGRLDATNVVTPLVSVITRIGIDHQKYLGDTIEKIAYEKAGIIKEGVPVATIDHEQGIMDVIRKAADEKKAMLHVVSPHEIKWPLGLLGRHQYENAALAVRAFEIAMSLRVPTHVGAKQSSSGDMNWIASPLDELGARNDRIAQALASTRWPGRLEIVSKNPLVILDGAHNPNGAEALAKFIRESLRDLPSFVVRPAHDELRMSGVKQSHNDRRVIIMLGVMADKDIEGIVRPLAEVADEFILTKPAVARAAEPEVIAEIIMSLRQRRIRLRQRRAGAMTSDMASAIKQTLETMPQDAVLVITGSLYTVGEARQFFHRC